jgi:hypothetical protein
MKEYYRILCKDLCFGIEVLDGIVVQAAPCAKWMLGKYWPGYIKYWERRGADIHKY